MKTTQNTTTTPRNARMPKVAAACSARAGSCAVAATWGPSV
ncbi:hypothetical protein [Streptomyces sp. H51]|nr:hypothetical protein [Streptomyces sp. H51]